MGRVCSSLVGLKRHIKFVQVLIFGTKIIEGDSESVVKNALIDIQILICF